MRHSKAFTLIELLVVIAIIAILLSVLIPALSVAKAMASGAVCMANLSALDKTWYLYQEDNDMKLVGLSNYYSGARATPYRWVEPPLTNDSDDPEKVGMAGTINLQTQLNGIRAGALYSYTGSEKVYHCPNDKYWKTKPEGPWISYAGSGLMNSEDFIARNGLYGDITQYRTVANVPGASGPKTLICVTKFNQIKAPANRFTFVEEDYSNPSGKNQPYYYGGFVLMNGGDYWAWWDWPAWYHNGRSTLGFADGHAEKHDWKDPRTLKVLQYGNNPANGGYQSKQDNNEDIVYMNNGYVPAGW
jgi:prepilin-type N-terminal cleavage/methylation domain-containing protein/prepilin-type processing-associated H-X9-DG protein